MDITEKAFGKILFALTFCLPAIAATADPLVVESRAAFVAELAEVRERGKRIHVLGRDARSADLLDELHSIESNETLSALARNHLIDTALQALSGVSADDTTRNAVAAYVGRPVDVFIRMPEERHAVVVPLYDLSASAALTLRIWDEKNARQTVADRLQANTWAPAQLMAPDVDLLQQAWQRGTEQAFATADLQRIANARNDILSAHEAGLQLGDVALIAGRRLQDRELLHSVAMRGQQRTAIAALQAATERLSTSDALQVLDAARSRDDVATAAVLQLASLTDREPRAYDTLFELLDDDTLGGAAALALSRSESAQSLADIRALILGSQSETKRLRAALALRLSDSNASRALAAELRDARDLDDDLRRALL